MFAMFTEKHLCWSLFLIKLKRDSNISVFLWNFQNGFTEHIQWWKYLMKSVCLLQIRTMKDVILCYLLTLQRLFNFVVRTSFLSSSFFFSYFFVDSTTCWGTEVTLWILKIKQWSFPIGSSVEFRRISASALFRN